MPPAPPRASGVNFLNVVNIRNVVNILNVVNIRNAANFRGEHTRVNIVNGVALRMLS